MGSHCRCCCIGSFAGVRPQNAPLEHSPQRQPTADTRGLMESNDFDGAMRQKERVRAPRRRQVQENEDEESVRRTSQLPPCPAPLSDTHLPRGGRVYLWAAPRSQDGEIWTRQLRPLPPRRRAGAVARSRRKRSPRASDLACGKRTCLARVLCPMCPSSEPGQRQGCRNPWPASVKRRASLGWLAMVLCALQGLTRAKPRALPDPHAGSRTIRSTTRTRTTRAPR